MISTPITQKENVKKSSSNELRKKIQDHQKDNDYLANMTAYNSNKSQLIQDGIAAERIR